MAARLGVSPDTIKGYMRLAQDLAKARSLAADVAFSAGLLHDFGKVVAIACIEELIQNREDVAPKVEEEWTEIIRTGTTSTNSGW